MRVLINIPKEFEEHYCQDGFKDSFERLINDSYSYNKSLSGNYERETLKMLIDAFEKSVKFDLQLFDKYLRREMCKRCFMEKSTNEDLQEAYLRGYDSGCTDWLKDRVIEDIIKDKEKWTDGTNT